MKRKDNIEARLLGLEQEFENKIEDEIAQAKKEIELQQNKQEVFITDFEKISPDKKFDKNTIYRVFNRKQKTETFINGEQAENMIKYTDDYVIRFDHRIEYQ